MNATKTITGILGILLACSCAADPAELNDEPSSSSAALSAGTNDPNLGQLNAVSLGANCAGVALDEQWVLTTAHCAETLTNEVSIVTMASTGEQQLVRHADGEDFDIGFVHVHPFTTLPGGRIKTWTGSTAALANAQVKCFGRLNTAQREWRTSTFTAYENPDFRVRGSIAGQDLDANDEGVGCFYDNGTSKFLVGIQHSTVWDATHSKNAAKLLPLEYFSSGNVSYVTDRSWVAAYRPAKQFFSIAYWASALGTNVGINPTSQHALTSWAWDEVVMLRNDTVLLYDKDTGLAQVGVLERVENPGAYGWYMSFVPTNQYSLEAGFSHIVNVGMDKLFFYKSNNGHGVITTLNSHGVMATNQTITNFSTGWGRIAGSKNGVLTIFGGGTAVFAKVSPTYQQLSIYTGLGTNWTNIEPVGDDRLFFYEYGTGSEKLGVVNSSGALTFVGSPATQTVTAQREVLGLRMGQVVLYKRNANDAQQLTFDASGNPSLATLVSAPIGNWPAGGTPNALSTLYVDAQ